MQTYLLRPGATKAPGRRGQQSAGRRGGRDNPARDQHHRQHRRAARPGSAAKRHLELVCPHDGLKHQVDVPAYEAALSSEAKATAAVCGRTVVFGALGARGQGCPECAAALMARRSPRRRWARTALRCLRLLRGRRRAQHADRRPAAALEAGGRR